MPWAGIAAGAGSVISGLIGGGASKSAAKTQSAAAQQAAQLQYQMFQQVGQWLAPFRNIGGAAVNQLGGLLGLPGYQASGVGGMGTGSIVQPFQPTMDQLSATPGYQFTLQQALRATGNQASAMGLGGGIAPGGRPTPSGPEGQGLQTTAAGLASQTYQQQFNNYWTQLGNIYNMLSGQVATGGNAAAMTGQAGTNAATSIGNTLQAGAAAQAGGQIGAASAVGQGIAGAGNAALITSFINSARQQNPLGSTGTPLDPNALTLNPTTVIGGGPALGQY